jgi:cytochrome c-type biogenesis protein
LLSQEVTKMARVAETRRLPLEPGYLVAVLLALGAVFLGVLGYQLGFLGFVYKLMLPQAFARVDVLALGAVMGVAAFFSPCAFPLLPGYMTYQLQAQGEETRFIRSLYLGVLGALGLVAINGFVGLVVAALGSAAPFNPDPRQDPWIVLAPRLLGGAFVTYLGALYLLNRSLSLGLLTRLGGLVGTGDPASQHPARGTFFYGALYNLIGIGCTGALMLALVLYALTAGGFWTALGAFLVFSGTMAILMVAVTAMVGVSGAPLARRLKVSIPAVRRVSGAVMLVVGALTVAFVLQGNGWFTSIFFPFFS